MRTPRSAAGEPRGRAGSRLARGLAGLLIAVSTLVAGCSAAVAGVAELPSSAVADSVSTGPVGTDSVSAGSVSAGSAGAASPGGAMVGPMGPTSMTPLGPTSMAPLGPSSVPMASPATTAMTGPSMPTRSASGDPHSGIATVSDGAISVTHGSPAIQIEIYQDALCPICGAFEQSFGADINAAIDDGRLGVTYQMLTFLDRSSASGTYSTRASGALLCVASLAGAQPGLFQDFHAALFAPGNQPAEGAASDLSNAELAALATTVGAPANAVACIRDGDQVAAATQEFRAASTRLTSLGLQVATPTIVRDGRQIRLSNTWLTDLLSGG